MAQAKEMLTEDPADLSFGPFPLEKAKRLWQGDHLVAVTTAVAGSAALLRRAIWTACDNGVLSALPRIATGPILGIFAQPPEKV